MCVLVCRQGGAHLYPAPIVVGSSRMVTRLLCAREPIPDHEQKKVALSYLGEAWAEARLDGIDDDCMAQACLFAAIAELVSTYGEDAAAHYAEALPARIRNGEFSLRLLKQGRFGI